MRVATASVVAALAVASLTTPAAADISNNPNAQSLTLQCPQGTITGTTGSGSSLLLDGGGVAVLQGLTTAAGEEVIRVNRGLDGQGRLVRCTYDSPRIGADAVAYVFFAPGQA